VIFLETGRLTLRRFTVDDLDNLVALDGDPEVMHFITGGRTTSREELETDFLPAFLSYYERFDGYGFWAAIEKSSGDFLGWFHFRPPPDAPADEPELGYRLRKAAWGKGYATEGSRALIHKGFTEFGVRRVTAYTMAVNKASRGVMAKSGLSYVRTFFEDWTDVIEGAEHGEVEYALTREDWELQLTNTPASTPAPSIRAMADLSTPMAIRVAATLGLVEHTGSAGATAEQLASATGTATQALRSLLGHLVTIGVLVLDAESGRYRPTDLGAQLSEDAPEGIKPLLDITSAGGRAELAFVDLLETITTGTPAYVHRYGRDFWTDLDASPELRRSFDAQMKWRFRTQATQIAERFDWSRFSEIVDVGGGDGTVLAAILHAHPGLRGWVLDLTPAAAAATEGFAAAGLDSRAGAVSGSFFDPLPVGADVYLLSDILHDWDDDHAREILAGCRRAAAPDGTVLVIEPVLGEGSDTAIDLFMLMCFGGRERTVDGLAELAAGCGLVLRGSGPVADGRTSLEFGVAPLPA
jgi:RimJ/RimL family protein N-acetyltransferase